MKADEIATKEEVSSRIVEALLASGGWSIDVNGHYRTVTTKGKHLRLKLGTRTVVVDVNQKAKRARRLRIASAFYSNVLVHKEENGKYRIFVGGIEI